MTLFAGVHWSSVFYLLDNEEEALLYKGTRYVTFTFYAPLEIICAKIIYVYGRSNSMLVDL